jgi:hypothetical protein
MTGASRRGSSLVELVVALSGLLILAALVSAVIIIQLRVPLTQEARSGLGNGLRTGVTFLKGEWRGLTPVAGDSTGDLLSLASDALTYRASRASAFACAGGEDHLLLRAEPWYGWRQVAVDRDSLLVLAEGDTTTGADDRWVALPVTSLGSGSCAGGSAIMVGTILDSALVQRDFRFDAPVIAFEIMQVKSYPQGSETWLGVRSVSSGEVIQPLLGPLDASGLRLNYLDAHEAPTNVPAEVRTILATLPLVSEQPVHAHGFQGPRSRIRDSAAIRLTLQATAGR